MEPYMGQALFPITLEAMKSDIDDIALQGIEFWSTVSEEEIDLSIEESEAMESGEFHSTLIVLSLQSPLVIVSPLITLLPCLFQVALQCVHPATMPAALSSS